MTISGNAIVAGVMGWPVAHSLSPRVHGYWLRRYGIDGAYIPMAVPPSDIADALRALPKLGLSGCNVTVPHKEAALACVDEVSDIARRIGAVNTIVVRSNGALFGTNTDADGFRNNILAAVPGWNAADGPAVVLGAGGAARAVVAALVDDGCPEVRVVNRTANRAERLAKDIGGPVFAHAWSENADAMDGAAIAVNTTTLGMTNQPPLNVDIAALPLSAVVADIVYSPLRTAFMTGASDRGNTVVGGLGMLLHQARPGFAAWFGVEPDVTDELEAFVRKAVGD